MVKPRRPFFQMVQTAGQLLLTCGVRQSDIPLRVERGAGYQIDMGRFQRRLAKRGRVGDGAAAELLAEMGRHIEEGIESAIRHLAADARQRVEPAAYQIAT